MCDTLWTKAAIEFIYVLVGQRDATAPRSMYSISTVLPTQLKQQFIETLSSAANPQPVNRESDDFSFCQPGSPSKEAAKDEALPLVVDAQASTKLFFTLQKGHAAQQVVVPGAPKVRDSSAMVAIAEDLAEYDSKTRVIRLAVNDKEDLDKTCFIFTNTTFYRSELQRMYEWRLADTLHYHFGVQSPHPDELSCYLGKMMPLSAGGAGRDFYSDEATESEVTRSTLRFMEKYGYAQRQAQPGTWAVWRMTSHGLARVQIAQTLLSPRVALSVREGVPQQELTAFELQVQLAEQGWINRSWGERGRPAPYISGSAKVWWVFAKTKRWCVFYFRALLLADSHGQPVPHGKSPAFYKSLCGGEDLQCF